MRIDVSVEVIMGMVCGIFLLLPIFLVVEMLTDDNTTLIIWAGIFIPYITTIMIFTKFSARIKYRCKITQEEAVCHSPYFCRTHKEVPFDHFNQFKVFDDNKNEEILIEEKKK